MAKRNPRASAREARRARVRRKVRGTAERPRLCVFRSGKHMYAQVIDDDAGRTIAAASTLLKEVAGDAGGKTGTKEAAKAVGKLAAKRAIEQKVEQVVFDRNGYLYHGRVQSLAEGAREAGLKF